MDGIHRARRKRTPGSETVKRLAHVGQFGRSLRPNREVWHHALSPDLRPARSMSVDTAARPSGGTAPVMA